MIYSFQMTIKGQTQTINVEAASEQQAKAALLKRYGFGIKLERI